MFKRDTEFSKFRKSSSRKFSDNFLDKFQDPTYLGFKIFFPGLIHGFTPIEEVLASQNNNSGSAELSDNRFLNAYKDRSDKVTEQIDGLRNVGEEKITTLNEKINENTKGIWEKGNFERTLPDTVNSEGLFGSHQNPNSALYYLLKIGDIPRVKMLMDFMKMLSEINTKYDHYFQSVDGLGEIWKRDYTEIKFKKEITIGCLESIDLRITSLMDLYRKIVYDWENRRIILPDNLRTFDMTVKVFDFRDFYGLKEGISGVTSFSKGNVENTEFFGNDILSERTQLNFDLKWCEFLPDDSGTFLSSIKNDTPEMATQTIKISTEKIVENNMYRILNSLANSNGYYFIKDYLRREVEFFANPAERNILANVNDFQNTLLQATTSGVSNLVGNRINNLFLGNVYGFTPSTFTSDPTRALRNASRSFRKDEGSGELGNTFGNTTFKSDEGKDLGNVYGE